MGYVWNHDLPGERERLELMSKVLDPWTHFYLSQIGVGKGWTCLEVGAGNGSVSKWLATQVGAEGHVVASDLDLSYMADLRATNLETKRVNIVSDRIGDSQYDLVTVRATLHHIPQRRAVVGKLYDAVKPGGWLLIDEPDFYPTWTVTPATQRGFWSDFIAWAKLKDIDYYVGRKIAPWVQDLGPQQIDAHAHTIAYRGSSDFARWWQASIQEVADLMLTDQATSGSEIDQFMRLYDSENYWTRSIAFTATKAQKLVAPS